MRCLAIDDESPALFLMEDNIKRIPSLELVKCCKNAFEARDILQLERIDLIFLDIEMPGVNGLEFLKSLLVPPLAIFTTAYKQYALEGYALHVIDYLLKPIAFERFVSAVNKASEYYHLKKSSGESQAQSVDYFFVHAEYTLIKIEISQISYIESLKDYIKIYLMNEPRPVITRLSMRTMEERLPENDFARIHKASIIPIRQIHSIRKNQLIHLNGKAFPIGEHYRENLFAKIKPQKLLR